jgi:ligand-binding sensor domain-containing protein
LDCSFHNDIAETSDGVYWVATNSDGVFWLDLRAGATAAARGGVRPRFTRYPVGSEPVTNRVNVLYRDPDRILWAGTDGGLFALNEARGEQVFSPVALRIPLRPDIQVQIWTLVNDRSGSLWIGTKYGLVRRLPDGGMIHVQIQPSSVGDDVSALMMAGDGRLWVAHRAAGLIAFNPESVVRGTTVSEDSRPLPVDARRYTTKDGLDNDLVQNVRQSADGRIWIRTFGATLTEFDGKVFRTYRIGPWAITAGALTEDREGNLWLGTNVVGALKITKHGWTTYGEPDGLGASVTSILETQAGDLYVSSRAWLVSQFRGGRFTTVRPGLPGTITDASWRDVNNVLLDHAGEWWIGTRTGLYRFGKTRRFEDLARARPAAV